MRILAAIDLKVANADWLARRAAAWAAPLGATLDLLYVVAPGLDPTVDQARLSDLLAATPCEKRGHARVVHGDPAEALVSATARYDLLAVGSREPPMLERLLNGPMATRILHGAQCPVLVLRGEGAPARGGRLLLGVSPQTAIAPHLVEAGGRLAAQLGASLDLLYAIPVALPPIRERSVRERAEREWQASVEPERNALSALMLTHVPEAARGQIWVERGEAGEALIRRAAEAQAVVVGSRERTGLVRMILGSIAHKVVRNAPCDVISLPTGVA